jgi:cyanophycin synthetase
MKVPQSIDIVKKVLASFGYTFEARTLGLSRKNFTMITSPEGDQLVLATNAPLYPFSTSSARLISADKISAYEFVTQTGVSTPRTVIVKHVEDTIEAVELLHKSQAVIVKPARASGSAGLTLDITAEQQLHDALAYARTSAPTVIVQNQFYGEEVRFVVINGRAQAAILRKKPAIIGDGTSTVAQLIERENAARQAIDDTLVPYPQLDETIIPTELLTSQEVLSTGVIRELSKSTMIKGGASIYDIIDTIDKGYLVAAEQAAAGMGKGFIAVDMMIADYSRPSSADNYVFIEFNLNPALALFYSCRDGNHFTVAEDFLCPMLMTAMKGIENV